MNERAWAAGLFVGEGSSGCYPSKNCQLPQLTLGISMMDERAIRRFAAAWMPEVDLPVYRQVRINTGKVFWRVVATGKKATKLGLLLLPYIRNTDKGDQFEIALQRRRDSLV